MAPAMSPVAQQAQTQRLEGFRPARDLRVAFVQSARRAQVELRRLFPAAG